ncbi:MAG TPA: platelet-activating factor acetylhydrolase IB subunit [Isosphaeraceae bacterium]|nr:platelet-activating factor acetylhydrolase IB subunit [Isosphaeraceae bacterium]
MGIPALVRRVGSLGVVVCLTAGLPARSARAQGDSTTEPVSRPGGWMQMHESFLERTKDGPIDLLFLGDSITQGWRGGGKSVWERYYGERNAANFGIGGDRTQHVLWRLDHGEVDGIHPKVLVLMIGTNNVGSNTTEEIAEGVTAIVKKLREKLPETKILLLAIFPRDEHPSARRDRLQVVNQKISKLDDGQMVKYLDIGPKFVGPDGTISKEIMPDFLHLSSKGYRILADAIEPTLWSMLEGT